MTARKVNPIALLVLTAGLFACASAPVSDSPADSAEAPPPQNMMAGTDDLGMVADMALQLADSHGNDQVLVVFDIDNTLLAMEQDLGSDQWYYWQKDREKEGRVPRRKRVLGSKRGPVAASPGQSQAAHHRQAG